MGLTFFGRPIWYNMIVSRQNERVKFVRSLKQKKYRDEHGLYLVEGEKSVKEAIISSHEVVCVYVSENFSTTADLTGVETVIVSSSVFESISDEVSPQGILAVVKKPQQLPCESCLSTLLLDRVSDPGNVGAIIRTAVASGYKDIYFLNCADPYSPKAVRSSMSGIFKINAHFVDNSFLDGFNVPLVIATMEGENVFSYNSPKQFCLVIGNEANGVSDEIKSKATHKVSIPMQNGMESLNASVSAGILMYMLKNNR